MHHSPSSGRPRSADSDKRTLCLDLDDTLTLMTFERIKDPLTGELRQYDTIVTAHDNPEDWGMVYFRPYLRTFLEAVSHAFEVVLFTAACQDYADQIVNAIDPENRLFHHRLYRDSCVECIPNPSYPDSRIYIKDLRILGRDLQDVILVDNSLLCFAYQLDNGIVCNPFKGNSNDRELIAILDVLGLLKRTPGVDTRRFFRKMYGLADVIHEFSIRGGRKGIERERFSVIDQFLDTPTQEKRFDIQGKEDPISQKSTAMNTPTSRETAKRTERDRVVDPRHSVELSGRCVENGLVVNNTYASMLSAPPIFINTILPGLERTRTPINTLYESIVKNQVRSRVI
jgi:Dullard-like phosphatase family protein